MSGKLITNQTTTLSDLFLSILPETKDICFLVGYFYFSGFPEFYKNVKDKKMRILGPYKRSLNAVSEADLEINFSLNFL